ncbi:MAG: hypothetical protein NTY45_09755, partial [Elusimicrobia bacterium]|nr:hypothetical protein [Elusimicrobiota bacterium]
MKRIKLSLLFLLLFPRSAQSWWSFEKANIPWSSHRLITQSAMSLIQETGEYPDLNKFSSVILEATTGDANDAKAHGKILAGDPDYPLANEAGRFNGGPFDLWQKRALARYNAQDFAGTENSSYYYFALMTHLLQDQAVPAHAANIYHGQIIGDEGCYSLLWNTTVPCDPDDLELYSGGRGPGFIVRGKEYGKKAEDYYYNGKNIPASIVRQTQSKLTGWEYPDTGDIAKWRGSQYWIKNNVTYSGEGFIGNLANTGEAGWWGHYGGTPNNTDMYLYLTLSTPFGKTDSPVIAENQLKEAAEFTAGMLMAVSRSLPPLIKEPYINNVPASDATVATVYTNAPNTIRFKLMDNRTSAVDLHLEVDAYGGRPIVSVSTIAVFLSSGTMLPWELQYTTQWDGKYADGTPIPSGDHKLFASGTDADGNRFEYEIGAFMVSNGPQLGVFVCEGGFTNLSSGGLIQNVPVFQHPCSEVKIVIHKDRSPITEVTVNTPSGSITLPGGDVVNYTLPASPDGHYTITAKDQTGPPNSASFTLTTLDFQSDMDASKSTYGSGEFTPQLTFKGTSSPSTFARIDFCKAEPVSGGGLSSRCGPIVE